MNVVFLVRDLLHEWPGGDTVQIDNTASALRDQGVSVTIASSPDIDLSPFDVVHLWHLERVHESYLHFTRAKAAGKKTVLSTIYWPWNGLCRYPLEERSRFRGCKEDLKNFVRLVKARSAGERRGLLAALGHGWLCSRQDLLEHCDLLLPNSEAEAVVLRRENPHARCHVVPNAVSMAERPDFKSASEDVRREGIVCVGHFDPRKNQLNLVRALRDKDIPVYFIGDARQMHKRYYRQCLELAGANMHFLGRKNSDEVAQLMAQAVLHVCPSHFETPGLVNLEAGLAGCGLAIGDCPPVREYFGEHAVYFDSNDPLDIRTAVLGAMREGRRPGLVERIRTEFSWEVAAKKTLEAYELLVK